MSPPINALRRGLLLALAWRGANAADAGSGAADAGSGAASAASADASDDRIDAQRALRFPRDHGAHPGARIEWWYATGWLVKPGRPADEPAYGFQLTFFRSRTGLPLADGAAAASRFSPRQLLFAHAAVTDLAARRHHHAQRLLRWSGDEALPEAHAARADTRVQLGNWWMRRQPRADGGAVYQARLPAPEAGLTLALGLTPTQPLLLQGQAGFSRKGPQPQQASHYYSQPQLAVQAQLSLGGQRQALDGTGWLDHEWSDALLDAAAVGWDWIGINLADGGALTAFVLRRRDGSALWAGGSHRPRGGPVQAFAPQTVAFEPLREWQSPQSGARYPVAWRITTPLGMLRLEALLDAQELDSRNSTGAVYWEGLVELRAPAAGGVAGPRLGLGYLEMTGRASPLRLG